MNRPAPAAATQGSLQHRPRAGRVPAVPGFADFGIQRKVRLFVRDVADRDEGKECGEEQEHVDREDGARVQERPGDSHQRAKQK